MIDKNSSSAKKTLKRVLRFQITNTIKALLKYKIHVLATIKKTPLWQVFLLIVLTISLTTALLFWPLFFNGKKIVYFLQNYWQDFFKTNQQQLVTTKQLVKTANKVNQQIQINNKLFKLLPIGKEQRNAWLAIGKLSEEANIVLEYLFTGKKNIVFLLQNSHEIRATGGFMGSYAKLSLQDGQLQELYFNDIYAVDGQFAGFMDAPAPVVKYLAQGGSWRLPDANWHPDFAQSAKTILELFNAGGEKDIDMLVAINLALVEDILKIIGPIYLSDYQLEVNAGNLADVARSERSAFFPGTKQKQQFFTLLFNQLKFKLGQLDNKQKLAIIKQIGQSLSKKDLQFYSINDQVQTIVVDYHLAGNIYLPAEQTQDQLNKPVAQKLAYLMLVESNVGINKANKLVSRQVNLFAKKSQLHIQIDFNNQNLKPAPAMKKNRYLSQAEHLSYINYQRLILPKEVVLVEAKINQQVIEQIDEELIQNYNGETFKQIGFLITVPEQKTAILEATIDYLQPIEQLFIQRQAGLPITMYTIVGQNSRQLVLDRDMLIDL